MGSTGSEAIRKAYNRKGKPKTNANDAYKLRKRPDIKAVITAMEAAIQVAEYQTPAGLRALVIQTLVQTMIDPETKDAVKIAAAKTLGTVTEVAAFTERKETRIIRSSEDAKSKLLAKLRDMMKANATDATIIDADSLLKELTAPVDEVAEGDPHPAPTPLDTQLDTPAYIHTIPLKQSQNNVEQSQNIAEPFEDSDPTPKENIRDLGVHAFREDPPLGDGK